MDLVTFLEEQRNVGAANVSDVLGSVHVMHSRISALHPRMRAAGPAFTVRPYPGSIQTVHRAMAVAPEGSVLVVAGEGAVDDGALLGELMAAECAEKGLVAAVVDGAVRDTDTLREGSFPVFACGSTPRVGTNTRLGEVDVPVSCGGVVVRTGDVILADADGVVVIPVDEAEALPNKLRKLLAKEDELAQGIRRGESIAEMLGFAEKWSS